MTSPETKTEKIAALNDKLRQTGEGGEILITQGINQLSDETKKQVIDAIQAFSDFTPDDDPYQEHDFGSVEVKGDKIFWKIDYYDENKKYASPNPADEYVTNRVLTIMLAIEY